MPQINLFRETANHRQVSEGDVLFEPGDPAEEMYAVISGNIEIIRDGEVFENVGPGGIIGEVALLSNHLRAVTGRATEPSEIAIVTEDEFIRLVKMNPFFALEVMRVMADRLMRDGGVTTD